MSDTYAKGDSVIATRCLVTQSVPGQVRVEIPVATRGTVVSYDPVIRWAPYLVVFEAGHGGLVEIRVSSEKLGRVRTHEPLVPLLDDADLVAVEDGLTFNQPHRWCRKLHELLAMEAFTAYGVVLLEETRLMLWVTFAFVAVAYLHQFLYCRRLALIPEVLLPLTPGEDEELVVYTEHARWAAVCDVVVAVLLGTLVIHQVLINILGGPDNLPWFFVHLAATGLVWLLKMIEHAHAAHIYPKDS